ncbi:MAG: hypothetical protein WKF59_14585 [Chitinophagaceae bacterium]
MLSVGKTLLIKLPTALPLLEDEFLGVPKVRAGLVVAPELFVLPNLGLYDPDASEAVFGLYAPKLVFLG